MLYQNPVTGYLQEIPEKELGYYGVYGLHPEDYFTGYPGFYLGEYLHENEDDMPTGNFGTLVFNRNQTRFSYQFTPDDVLWTARLIIGESGGRNNLDNQAVIWALFNRYAFFTHRIYPTFHQFIRAYSTPLQPVLRNWGAAKRNMNRPDFIRTGGFYAPPHNDIPRGQLRRFIELQRTPWARLQPLSARQLAVNALRGEVPNPVGNASEFANTFVYFRSRYGRDPNSTEWERYTRDFASRKNWTWIGPVPNLRQMRVNAFFIDNRVRELPQNAVRVIR